MANPDKSIWAALAPKPLKGFITLTHKNTGQPVTVSTRVIALVEAKGKNADFALLTLTVPYGSTDKGEMEVSETYDQVISKLQDA